MKAFRKSAPPQLRLGNSSARKKLAHGSPLICIDPTRPAPSTQILPELISLHAVSQAGLEFRADASGENAGVGKRTVGSNVEDADQRLHGAR